jgi:hypothetical protein
MMRAAMAMLCSGFPPTPPEADNPPVPFRTFNGVSLMFLKVSAGTLAAWLALLPCSAAAVEPMVGAELTWTRIDIAGESFNPLAARLRFALALTPDWEIGALAGSGIADDSDVSVTTEISEFFAGYVRYSASLDDDARLVLMLGYGDMTLDVASPLPGFPGSQNYSGVMYGISLQERLSRYPQWIGSLDLERWYDDQGLKISAISYGFRYAF